MSNPILYTMPGTCALAPNIAVAWLDAPVTIKTLERGDHKKKEYLSINPKGKVPALQFDDGDVLTEAAAILAYLGAEYGKEGYARDQKLGRKEAEALSYMTSEVHAAYGPHFAPQAFADSELAQNEIKAKTYEKLATHYARMDANLAASGDWYLKQRSFADAYLYVLTRWIEQTPLSIDDYPNLKKYRARMEADEGVKLALQRQNMEPVS
jgi:glutathione S-transferase